MWDGNLVYWMREELYAESVSDSIAARDIRISNQCPITRALPFAQPQAYYQANVTHYHIGS